MSGGALVPFDCTACGACCAFAGEVTVTETDPTPRYLTRSVRRSMGFASWEADLGTRRMARDCEDRCAAFRGEIGSACRCSIYDRRPKVCREFEPGSQGCVAARVDAFGLDCDGLAAAFPFQTEEAKEA